MKCPYCKKDNNRVQGERKDQWKPENVRIRYRKCLSCGRNFKTTEDYTEQTKREVEQWKESQNCKRSMK